MADLSKGNGALLLNPVYADLTITCEDQTYNVHRAIVCSKSPVLARECDSAFKVG